MSRKVCHITSAHDRYDIRIFKKECVSLASNGYCVTLIVNDTNPDEIKDGVKIVSTGFLPKNRMERFHNSKKLLLSKACEVNADIYHLHDPDLLPLGNKLKKKNKIVIFDSHEDVPKQIRDKYWIPKPFRRIVAKLYSIYENKCIKRFDSLIGVTPHVVNRFSTVNKNSFMVTNYPIVNLNSNIDKNPRDAICFAGSIGKQWNHDIVINAIKDIEGVKYVLAGRETGNYMNLLKSLPAWDKVEYKGQISHENVKEIYAESIAGMALSYSSQTKGEGTLGNTKLFEYMEAGLPVICSNHRLWKEIIENNNCGICVDPRDVGQVRDAIKYIVENPDKAKNMGENGRRAVIKEYNWQTQEKVLLELYENL